MCEATGRIQRKANGEEEGKEEKADDEKIQKIRYDLNRRRRKLERKEQKREEKNNIINKSMKLENIAETRRKPVLSHMVAAAISTRFR